MATVLQIPVTNLTVGQHVFGPLAAPVGIQQIVLDIDRTAGTNSLNSLPATASLAIEADISRDGGATWQLAFTATAVGGTYTDDERSSPTFGQVFTHSTVTQTLPAATDQTTQFRAVLTVTGQRISVAGSLTLT